MGLNMNSFDQMVLALHKNALANVDKYSKLPGIEVEINPKKMKISQEEYDEFYKEFIFEKLKGKKLSYAFREKFSEFNEDILFNISISDEETDRYIRKFYLK